MESTDSTHRRAISRMVVLIAMASVFASTGGCTDGPLFQFKKISPYHLRQWRSDRALGPTFSQRLAELEFLKTRIGSMTAEDKNVWAGRLEAIVTSDTSPEMRAQAAQVLARIDSEATIRGLNAASTDEVEKVRLAVCRAWASRRDDHSRDMLLNLAQTDESDDVKQAAIAALGKYDNADVRSLLVNALDDKNPAIQQQAVFALRTITGRDYGGDFDAWRRFLDGESVEEPQPISLTARAIQFLPSLK